MPSPSSVQSGGSSLPLWLLGHIPAWVLAFFWVNQAWWSHLCQSVLSLLIQPTQGSLFTHPFFYALSRGPSGLWAWQEVFSFRPGQLMVPPVTPWLLQLIQPEPGPTTWDHTVTLGSVTQSTPGCGRAGHTPSLLVHTPGWMLVSISFQAAANSLYEIIWGSYCRDKGTRMVIKSLEVQRQDRIVGTKAGSYSLPATEPRYTLHHSSPAFWP